MTEHLHAVTGELSESPSIEALMAENVAIKGAYRELEHRLRAALSQIAQMKTDHEATARKSQLWPVAERLFVIWQRATKSKARFTFKRFEVVEPHIRPLLDADGGVTEHQLQMIDGPPEGIFEECAAAIIGRVYDHFSTERPNGTMKHYWEFERIFSEMDDSLARRPRDWRQRLAQLDPGPIVRGPRAT